MLKRFLIYGLLGPPLGDIMIFGVMMPIVSLFGSDPGPQIIQTLIAIPIVLPFAYLHGLVPALLAGGVDALLARWNLGLGWRLPAALFAGFIFAFIPLLSSIASGHLPGDGRLLFGLVGAVPAAICCWLSRDATKTG